MGLRGEHRLAYKSTYTVTAGTHRACRDCISVIEIVWSVEYEFLYLTFKCYFFTIVFTPYLSLVRTTRRYCPAASLLRSISGTWFSFLPLHTALPFTS